MPANIDLITQAGNIGARAQDRLRAMAPKSDALETYKLMSSLDKDKAAASASKKKEEKITLETLELKKEASLAHMQGAGESPETLERAKAAHLRDPVTKDIPIPPELETWTPETPAIINQMMMKTIDMAKQAELQLRQQEMVSKQEHRTLTRQDKMSQFEQRQAQDQSQFQQSEGRQASQFAIGQSAQNARTSATLGQQQKTQDVALRKEFNALPEVKKYGTIIPIVQSAREAVNVDNPAADMNLVYAAAKVMDPDSVVRESETSMVVASGSPAQQFVGQFNYIAGGGRLTSETRQNLLNEIESRAKGHEQLYEQATQQYKSGAPPIGGLPKLGAGRGQSTPSGKVSGGGDDLTPSEEAELQQRLKAKGGASGGW